MADQDQEAAEDAGDITERADGAEALALAKKASDKTEDLDKTRDALVEAAAVSSGLWITYLGVLLYLTIAVGSVTHRDLFLESPITLPFVSVKLPLAGFFVLGPGLFLIMHAYVLLHFRMLAYKIATFDKLLGKKITTEAQATLRRGLPANVFVQFLAGPSEVRDGAVGLFLWLIALITLVIGPILLLLFFELQFLPYHNETISWWQRIAVGIDLGLLWLFWPSIAVRNADPDVKGETRFRIVHRFQSAGRIGIMLILTLASLPLLLLIATFPGEKLNTMLSWFPLQQIRAPLVHGTVDAVKREPASLWSDRLVVPGLDVIDHAKFDTEAKIAAAPETASLRGRDLRGAVLIGADLRRIDFTGANLQGAELSGANLKEANLVSAHLEGANLSDAHLEGADLSDAHLEPANLYCASDDFKGAASEGADPHCADLRRTSLSRTYLSGAKLMGADLHSTDLSTADLQGTNLSYADLHGADLRNDAHLQGADLRQARLQGAALTYADLRGANLSGAALQGADLSTTHLQGADLRQANLRGADLGGAGLQGVDLRDADLQGANLLGTDLQGADLTYAHLEGADLSSAGLQGANLIYAHLQGATLNKVFVWATNISDAGLDGAWVGAIDTQPWNQKIDAFPAATLPEAIAQIIKPISAGKGRESAKERLDQLLSLREYDQVSKIWRAAVNTEKPSGFDETVNDTWSRIGCDAEGAPYVMSKLIGRFNDLADKGKAVAIQFLDKDCQGGKGLDLASLKKISGLADLGGIRGAHAEAQGAATSAFSTPALPPANQKALSAPAPDFGDLSDRGEREVATPVAPDPLPRPAHHPQRVIHAAPNGNRVTLTGGTTALLNQQELARHRLVATTSDNSISSFFRSLFH